MKYEIAKNGLIARSEASALFNLYLKISSPFIFWITEATQPPVHDYRARCFIKEKTNKMTK